MMLLCKYTYRYTTKVHKTFLRLSNALLHLYTHPARRPHRPANGPCCRVTLYSRSQLASRVR